MLHFVKAARRENTNFCLPTKRFVATLSVVFPLRDKIRVRLHTPIGHPNPDRSSSPPSLMLSEVDKSCPGIAYPDKINHKHQIFYIPLNAQ
ncbi:hypothetical protein EV681_0039 [Advenella incenata]|uniref:Uncharacterized protein n=1 Tax=Advenella incenata TaxID=267800 RepID=A0A4Q7VPC3_9BURK|nr:hypothetical protein EV681_0039 [Advenella incenata]